MKETIKSYIDEISNSFTPIKEVTNRYLDDSSKIGKNGEIKIFHRPWVAPLNWGINLYPKAKAEWINAFKQRTNKQIPQFYQEFLSQINGCFIFDLSLYGLPRSIYEEQMLNRNSLQCHDLTMANINWANEYELNEPLFHFGGRAYSYDENIGYFSNSDNEIFSIRNSGEIIFSWKNFGNFLQDEIFKAEQMMQEELPDNLEKNEN